MFGSEVDAAARAHALAEYPREAVGYVVDGKYCPQQNAAPNPRDAFMVLPNPDKWDLVQAVIHSHTNGNGAPGRADMAGQVASDVPWGLTVTDGAVASPLIWWGDHVLGAPLIGRRFVPGVMDCYELGRAWYWQERGIKLPAVPRDSEWWLRGEDLLEAGFRGAGFSRVGPEDSPRAGDALLMAIPATGRVNHCAVLLEGDLMLHHRTGRLSCREPWSGAWRRLTRLVVRHEQDPR